MNQQAKAKVPESPIPTTSVDVISVIDGSPKGSPRRRTFADVVFGPRVESLKLSNKDGRLIIDEEAYTKLCEDWKFSVVFKAGSYMAYDMFAEMLKSWHIPFDRACRLGNEKRDFLVKFNSYEDYKCVIARRNAIYNDVFMRIQPYDPGNCADCISSIVHLWVSIPNLPPFMYNDEIFEFLGGQLGKLVEVDEYTRRKLKLDAAKICVEVDLMQPLKKNVLYDVKGVECIKEVKYYHVPLFCVSCKKFGHVLDSCWSRHHDLGVDSMNEHPMIKRRENSNVQNRKAHNVWRVKDLHGMKLGCSEDIRDNGSTKLYDHYFQWDSDDAMDHLFEVNAEVERFLGNSPNEINAPYDGQIIFSIPPVSTGSVDGEVEDSTMVVDVSSDNEEEELEQNSVEVKQNGLCIQSASDTSVLPISGDATPATVGNRHNAVDGTAEPRDKGVEDGTAKDSPGDPSGGYVGDKDALYIDCITVGYSDKEMVDTGLKKPHSIEGSDREFVEEILSDKEHGMASMTPVSVPLEHVCNAGEECSLKPGYGRSVENSEVGLKESCAKGSSDMNAGLLPLAAGTCENDAVNVVYFDRDGCDFDNQGAGTESGANATAKDTGSASERKAVCADPVTMKVKSSACEEHPVSVAVVRSDKDYLRGVRGQCSKDYHGDGASSAVFPGRDDFFIHLDLVDSRVASGKFTKKTSDHSSKAPELFYKIGRGYYLPISECSYKKGKQQYFRDNNGRFKEVG